MKISILNSYHEFTSNLNDKQKNLLKIIIFLLPIAFVITAVLLKLGSWKWYFRLMLKEDGPIEDATSIAYFVAFFVSLRISFTYKKRNDYLFCFMYLFLSIGLFFIAMEEISWGQRILNFKTPELMIEYNEQKEFTLHNVKGFPIHKLYIIVGLYGAFARFIIPRKIKISYASIVDKFVPGYYLFFYFFIVAALYLYYEGGSKILVAHFGEQFGWGKGQAHFMAAGDQEPAEFLLGCGFLLFVMINRYRQLKTMSLDLLSRNRSAGEKSLPNL
jgi:hypothetical protein